MVLGTGGGYFEGAIVARVGPHWYQAIGKRRGVREDSTVDYLRSHC